MQLFQFIPKKRAVSPQITLLVVPTDIGIAQGRIQTGLSGLYKHVRFLKEKDDFCPNNLIPSFRNFFIIYGT